MMEAVTQHLESQIDDYRMELATTRFEREYDKVFGRTSQLLEAERNRRQCMEQLLLQIENDSLHLQLDQAKQETIQAIRAESDARLQLLHSKENFDLAQNTSHTSFREIESLRRELASLNDAAVESKNLLSEKLRLSKDLSSAQSEVERLTILQNSSQALHGENLDLRKQLNILEVQIEQEKRSHERTKIRGSQQAEEIAALTLKLEETRQELSRARAARQNIAPPSSGERKSQYQSFNTKVPIKGGDDETPAGLQRPQEGSSRISLSKDRPTTALPRTSTKLNPEMTIATPGAVRSRVQQKQVFALPGEKSSFSITPFLNRTRGVEDSTMSSDDESDELQAAAENNHSNEPSIHREHGEDSILNSPTRKPQTVKLGSKNLKKSTLNKTAKSRKKLELLNGSDSGDEIGNISVSQIHLQNQAPAQRKRKLGAQRERSLFDDEEDGGFFRDTKKPGRKLAGTVQNTKSQPPTARASEFSPLKRDKKRF